MLKTWSITINGKPIAKNRPRFARRGKFVATYSDQETEEGRALWEIKNQLGAIEEPTKKPLWVHLIVWMPIPTSVSKKKQLSMINGRICPGGKDLDNFAKFYLDILNGVLWQDDRQIQELSVKKLYAENPRVLIDVFEIDGEMA